MADGKPGLGDIVPADLGELLRSRQLSVRRPVWGSGFGRHASRRVGLGHDFRDHRGYVPGDDPRQLDWRAIARRDRLVLRRTEAEDELSVVVIVDAGANMAYGTGTQQKIATSRALAAAFAWSAIRQGDRTGLAISTDGTIDDTLLRPSSGHERLDAILRLLAATEPRGRSITAGLLERIAPRLRPRSLVVYVSDLLDPATVVDDADDVTAELFGGLAQLGARGHDLVLVQPLHRDEVEFPWDDGALLRFEDPRGVRPLVEGSGTSLRSAYLARFGAHQTSIARSCEARAISHAPVVSDQPLGRVFASLLARLAGEAMADEVEAR